MEYPPGKGTGNLEKGAIPDSKNERLSASIYFPPKVQLSAHAEQEKWKMLH
jgi:hypothetical protein